VIEKQFYSINEAAKILELPPYVLRYWEKEFKMLRPKKNRAGRRVYTRREIEIVMNIKKLLYEEGFTIEGARKKLVTMKKEDIEQIPLPFKKPKDIIAEVKQELKELKALLSASDK
jgi:DNA-binding transcriptional MerR regulator